MKAILHRVAFLELYLLDIPYEGDKSLTFRLNEQKGANERQKCLTFRLIELDGANEEQKSLTFWLNELDGVDEGQKSSTFWLNEQNGEMRGINPVTSDLRWFFYLATIHYYDEVHFSALNLFLSGLLKKSYESPIAYAVCVSYIVEKN